MIKTFTIQAANNSGSLMFTSAAGEKSVLVFPTRDTAEAFVGSQDKAIEMRVVELTPDTVEVWAEMVRGYGAHHVILDPPGDGVSRRDERARERQWEKVFQPIVAIGTDSPRRSC